MTLRQQDIALNGAAIECRVYAEDPENNFFPSPGTIRLLRTPSGPWNPRRQRCLRRMERSYRLRSLDLKTRGVGADTRAKRSTGCSGLCSNTRSKAFKRTWHSSARSSITATSGKASSIPDSSIAGCGNVSLGKPASETERDLALIAAALADALQAPAPPQTVDSRVLRVEGRRSHSRTETLKRGTAIVAGERVDFQWNAQANAIEAAVNGREYTLETKEIRRGVYWFSWNGRSIEATVIGTDQGYVVSILGRHIPVEFLDSRKALRRAAHGHHEGVVEVRAPMPGKIVRILAGRGRRSGGPSGHCRDGSDENAE